MCLTRWVVSHFSKCLSGNIYFSFGVFISFSSVFECKFFEALAILSAVLLPIKAPVASADFELLSLKQFLLNLL